VNENVAAGTEAAADVQAQAAQTLQNAGAAANDAAGETLGAAAPAISKLSASEGLTADLEQAKKDLALGDLKEKEEELSSSSEAKLEQTAAAAEKQATDMSAPTLQSAEQALAKEHEKAVADAKEALGSEGTALHEADKALDEALTSPTSMSFHFKGLDFDKADLAKFRDDLMDQFRQKGVADAVLSTLKVRFRKGSIIADVISSTDAIQEIKEKAPSDSVIVDGVAAEVSNAEVCHDATPTENEECYKNVEWAKNTGIFDQPEDYAAYPALSSSSPLPDFQYALHRMEVTVGPGAGHHCPVPCSMSPEMEAQFAAVDHTQAAKDAGELVEEAVQADKQAVEDALHEESEEVTEAESEAEDVAKRAGAVTGGPQLAMEEVKDAVAEVESTEGTAEGAEKVAEDAEQALGVNANELAEEQHEAAALEQKVDSDLANDDVTGAEATSQEVVQAMQKADDELEAMKKASTDSLKAPALDAAKLGQDTAEEAQEAVGKELQELAAVDGAAKQTGAPVEAKAVAKVSVSSSTTSTTIEVTSTTTSTTEKPDEGWPWYSWALLFAGICCCLPLLGLACSAFMCYESVAWLFEGSGKRSPQKKRALNMKKARPAEPQRVAEMAPLMASAPMMAPLAPMSYQAPVQTSVVPTTVMPSAVYTTAPAPITTSAAPVVTYSAPAPSYIPAPATYVVEQFSVPNAYVGQPTAQVYAAAPGAAANYTYSYPRAYDLA